MKKTKHILFITDFKGMWPFAQNLTELFGSAFDNNFDYIDFSDNSFHTFGLNDQYIIHQGIINNFRNKYLILLTKLANIIIKKYNYYQFLKNNIPQYNHILILVHNPELNLFASLLKNNAINLNLFYAGSDFYRTSNGLKNKNISLLKKVDRLFFTNQQLANELLIYYKNYDLNDKINVLYFGTKVMEIIYDKYFEIQSIRKKYLLDCKIITITIGYSGSKEQQHIRIIKSILEMLILNNIYVLLPFTYSNHDPEYMARTIEILESNNISYRIFNDLLDDEEISELRLLSDITINMQTTDQASASLTEYAEAGNIMLIADWLPYKFWDDNKLFYYKVNFENLGEKLQEVILNVTDEKKKFSNNREIIYRNLSWKFTKSKFLEYFK